MAAQSRRKTGSLIDQLRHEPFRFGFFQAVRLLEWIARRRVRDPSAAQRHAVGRDRAPGEEIVRFRAHAALSFPAGSIAALHDPCGGASKPEAGEPAGSGPPELSVSFMGLIGPSGVLPQHYTRLVLQRVRNKDYGLRDFLDLFNHRSISLFYRAWEKERFAIGYERAQVDGKGGREDLFTQCLYCLIGFGTPHLRGRMQVDDEALLYYVGHFSHQPRSALGLEQVLRDYFGYPFQIHQFQGQWLYLSSEDRSLLPSPGMPKGQNCRVGMGFVVGQRVWDVQSRFRLTVGPLTYSQFRRFMPDGDVLRCLCELARLYVGPELDFDVQPRLRADEVPACRLSGDTGFEPRLGWNTWIRTRPMEQDVSEAVFFLEEV